MRSNTTGRRISIAFFALGLLIVLAGCSMGGNTVRFEDERSGTGNREALPPRQAARAAFDSSTSYNRTSIPSSTPAVEAARRVLPLAFKEFLAWSSPTVVGDVSIERLIPVATLSSSVSTGVPLAWIDLERIGDYIVVARSSSGERSTFYLGVQDNSATWSVSGAAPGQAPGLFESIPPGSEVLQVSLAYRGYPVDWWAIRQEAGAVWVTPASFVWDHADPAVDGRGLDTGQRYPLDTLLKPLVLRAL